MESLLRTRSGCFELKDSLKLEEIAALYAKNRLIEVLLPVDTVFEELKEVCICREYGMLAYNGNTFSVKCIQKEIDCRQDEQVRVYDMDQRFIGVFRYNAGKREFRVEKMFLDRED